jgi:hypothetical protein
MTLRRFWSNWARWRLSTSGSSAVSPRSAQKASAAPRASPGGRTALSRMMERGETLTAIAELAGVGVNEARAKLKSVSANTAASPDAPSAYGDATNAAEGGAVDAQGAPADAARGRSVSVEALSVSAHESRAWCPLPDLAAVSTNAGVRGRGQIPPPRYK